MSLLASAFSRCHKSGRPAFIPFVTAGDPSLASTSQVVEAVVASGADIVEIGFPYSDSLADGAVIQESYQRSLGAGTRVDDIFILAKHWINKFPAIPFVAMASCSLIRRRGPELFVDALKYAGFAGVIVPDLPVEESSSWAAMAQKHQLSFIQLVTPTTTPERAEKIAETTTGFLYVVSVTGITGTRESLPIPIALQLSDLRSITSLPLCVGFGISTPVQIAQLRAKADGIIVGSALVQCLKGEEPLGHKIKALSHLTRQLRSALGSNTTSHE